MLQEPKGAAEWVMSLRGRRKTKKEMGYKGREKLYLKIKLALEGERLQVEGR